MISSPTDAGQCLAIDHQTGTATRCLNGIIGWGPSHSDTRIHSTFDVSPLN
ncbi:MAG: hypothetical protein ACI91O_001281 [Candidatus Poriferisodalaceae bacterium]|jgi:hypothetical protein